MDEFDRDGGGASAEFCAVQPTKRQTNIKGNDLLISSFLIRYKLLPHRRLQLGLERLNNLAVRSIHFRIRQRLLRGTIGKSIRQALLSLGNIFASEHIE